MRGEALHHRLETSSRTPRSHTLALLSHTRSLARSRQAAGRVQQVLQQLEEEDTCVIYEEEDTCVIYEEEDTCVI
jgi:hypothetical protein